MEGLAEAIDEHRFDDINMVEENGYALIVNNVCFHAILKAFSSDMLAVSARPLHHSPP